MTGAVVKPQGWFSWGRIAALAGAMLLAGCQTIVPRTQGPPVTQPPPVTRPTPPVVQPGIPQDRERHRVALLVPMTGPNSGVGQSLANATQLALLDANAQKVRITTYDTATGAASAARRAIADGNTMILGPLLSENVRAIAPIARAAHVPIISYSNDTSVAGNGVFVMGYTPTQSIERVVDYARKSGITDFAGLVPRGLYGERASSSFLRAVNQAGGRVVAMQNYDRSASSLNDALAKLNAASPYQAILIADSANTAALAVPGIRQGQSSTARILGTELWNADTSIARNSALNGAWFASVSDGLYRQYATQYRARFGKSPFRLSSLGYDSVLLTIRIARNWQPGTPFPVGRLMSPTGFGGIDGAFRFGRDGVAERALEVQEIRSGQVVVISAAPRGFGQ